MPTRVVAAVLLSLALAVPAAAQSDLVAAVLLRVNVGDTVTVVDDRGARIRGRLIDTTATDLILQTDQRSRLAVPASGVREILRRGDSLNNGVLIGLGIGATIGLVGGLTVWDERTGNPPTSYVLMFSGLFAGLGAVVDAVIQRDRVVFRAPGLTVGPILDRGRRGFVVAVRW